MLFRAYTFHFYSHNILDITKNSIRLLFDSVFFHMVNSNGEFMAGTLWGLSIKSNESILSSTIIFSTVFLLSLFITFSAENYSILCLFILLLVYEFIYFSERKLIEKIGWYKEIRFHLTFSIRICHLLMIGFIFTNQ